MKRLGIGVVAALALLSGQAASAQNTHTLPLVPAASSAGLEGLVRIINRSNSAGTVRIHAIDDTGRRFGPVSLSLGARQTVNFRSQDLERGNATRGLPLGVGDGEGHWRLELDTALDVGPLAYIRTSDGFLTSMHDIVPSTGSDHYVSFFNPGSNLDKRSWLRLINPGDGAAEITITARDDAGETAPGGDVRLTLPAGAARTLTAQNLESGANGFSGRFGDGAGKWQLFVSSSRTIQAMSLLMSRTGHLSNLSTTPSGAPGEFVIAATGPTTVRPLETISLNLPGGLGDSDYLIQLDLSGAGTFNAADTIEMTGLTTDRNQLLVASPLTQALPDRNTAHRFAVRVRRQSDRALSNTLRFTIDDVTIPANLAGHPSVMLDVVLKAVYSASDDPLLDLGEPSIQPGLMFESAKRLGLDTTLPDVQAEAILQSMFGLPLVSSAAADGPFPPADSHDGPSQRAGGAVALSPGTTRIGANTAGCLFHQRVCDAYRAAYDCVGDAIARFTPEGGSVDADRCARDFALEAPQAWQEFGEKIVTVGSTALKIAPRLARRFVSRTALQRMANRLAMNKPLIDTLKTARTVSDAADDARDFVRDASGRFVPTKRGLRNAYEDLRDLGRAATADSANLIGEAEREYTSRTRTDAQRQAFSNLVNGHDRMRQDVEAIESLEDVYTGDQDPVDGVNNLPDNGGSGIRVGRSCESGYEEFPIDDETSTCVFASLVERNCYAGSRRVREPDLGGADACLYYQLDFFQSGGTCRENYARVQYRGRETCRWAGLGADQLAWYTLRKGEGEPPTTPTDGGCPRGTSIHVYSERSRCWLECTNYTPEYWESRGIEYRCLVDGSDGTCGEGHSCGLQ